MIRPRNLLAFAALACLSACSATSYGSSARDDGRSSRGFGAMGKLVVFDDYEADASAGGTAIGSGDVELDGFGAEAVFFGRGPDLLLGWDDREYENVDSTEFYAGLRFPLARTDVRPYLAGKVRYGLGLEFPSTALTTEFDSDEFWGWGAGGGVLAFVSDNLFFDFNLSYEDVFDDIDAEGVDVDLDGWVGTVGVGIAF